MQLTLTPDELCDIKSRVCNIFTEFELTMTKLNNLGSSKTMKEGDELLAYTWLLNDICFPDYQDNTYQSILSNKDIYQIYSRALQIQAGLKHNTL